MFVKNVYTFRNLPVEESERTWTDCLCTIISAIFALTLFILACCTFNRCTAYHIQSITMMSTIRWSQLEKLVREISMTLCLSTLPNLKISALRGIVYSPVLKNYNKSNAQQVKTVRELLVLMILYLLNIGLD
jgi:cobalamin biosynthesis protein CobD/CbiB